MPPELLEWISRLGIGGVFAFMWWRSEQRADRERDLNEELAKSSITANVQMQATLQAFKDILTAPRAGG